MKKTVLLLVFALVGLTTFAQEKKALKAAIKEIVEKQSGGVIDTPQFQQLIASIPDRNKEAFKSEIKAKMSANYDKTVDIFLEVYSKEEINALIEFYKTPLGKQILDKTPEITERQMLITQSFMMEFQTIYQKYMEM
ncbi:DUF2059 domain-containing protein [Mesonia sp. K7]|uniref:DUF2059 domain-containing protein n=1 Tax=Mesonia sp. K7 TaxID=2218606 RepID=UPI000DA9A11C|nr:DUF2059 domain-containing protein [Mesonia sp. K7]PZD78296.1 hypothetical protein DNG35_06240 [Mesonia sp. K7]